MKIRSDNANRSTITDAIFHIEFGSDRGKKERKKNTWSILNIRQQLSRSPHRTST